MSEGTCRKMFKEDKDGDTAPVAIKHDRELHARIRELQADRLRLAKHHFGDHSEECDDCGEQEPSESAIRILQPLGIVDESGSVLHGSKLDAILRERGPNLGGETVSFRLVSWDTACGLRWVP